MTKRDWFQSEVSGRKYLYRFLTFAVVATALVVSASAHAQESTAPAATAAPTPAECGIPGHHALLERMSTAFVLNCDQEKKLEPLLHDEESVSKPLLSFQAFTPEEKKEVMLEVKVAARKQILPLLNPEQQTKMDAEIDATSKGGGMGGHHGKAGGKKKTEPDVDPFVAERSLCEAISKYSALTDEQKNSLILRVKKASLRPEAPPLTPDQAKIVNSEIEKMS